MNIAIIDAELADKKHSRHRFPNLACMKLSSFHKAQGNNVELCIGYNNLEKYDKVYIARVFTDTTVPQEVLNMKNVEIGGTGFFYDKYDNAPMLPKEVEHSKPDYKLYDRWVQEQKAKKVSDNALKYYTDFSIGFTTRGCTRKCPFCVNRHSSAVLLASPINEFFDLGRKKICLLDDNIFAYKDWKLIFDELQAKTKEHSSTFEYKQGMDLRLLTEEKAAILANSRYSGHFIFAFDNIKDKAIIEKNCALLRKHSPEHSCKFFLFCAYESQDAKDIATVFERIETLWKYKCLGYIMKHERYRKAVEPYRNMYVQLGRWCNQPQFQWMKSFKEFCTESGGKAIRELERFEKLHPEFQHYVDMVYPHSKSKYKNELKERDEMERIEKMKELDSLMEAGRKELLEVVMAQNKYIVNNTGTQHKIAELYRDFLADMKPEGKSTRHTTPKPEPVIEESKLAEQPGVSEPEGYREVEKQESKPVVDAPPSVPQITRIVEATVETTNIEQKDASGLPAFGSLKLNKRIRERLRQAGLDSVGKITSKTKDQIYDDVKYIRKESVEEIEEALKTFGLSFKTSDITQGSAETKTV